MNSTLSNATIVLILLGLLALAIKHIINKAGTGGSCCSGGSKIAKKINVNDRNKSNYPYTYRIGVEGMVCAGCIRTVENAINSVDGLWAAANLEHKEALVRSKHEMTRNDFLMILDKTSYTLTEFEER